MIFIVYFLQTNYNNIIFPTFWTIYYNELLVNFFLLYTAANLIQENNNNKITNTLNKNYNLNVFICGACIQVCRKKFKLYKKYLW